MIKKAQNEIMGFAMIVIIVLVLGMIILSLSIGRGGVVNKTNVELTNFLEASMKYTTNCTTSYIPQYKTLEVLIKEVHKGGFNECKDSLGNNILSVDSALNNTIEEVMQVLGVNESASKKAYNMTMNFRTIDTTGMVTETDNFYIKSEGNFVNCTFIQEADHVIQEGSGNIIVRLKVCEG